MAQRSSLRDPPPGIGTGRGVARTSRSALGAPGVRSPALVWRRSEREPVESRSDAQRTPARDPAIASPAPLQDIESIAVRHAGSVLRSQPLDPAFVDRIAEDVVRRIDRRLRIERERRGL